VQDGPIIGVIFKCSQCDNYDLCEPCEKKDIHKEHTFLKINEAIKREKKEMTPLFK